MNLHGIVSGAIQAVNPFQPGTLLRSKDYTTVADGTQQPIYEVALLDAPMQVQALQFKDLTHLASMNIQGSQYKIYIHGRVEGVVRTDREGGDIIRLPRIDNPAIIDTWLITLVLERWPNWSAVAVTLQNGS